MPVVGQPRRSADEGAESAQSSAAENSPPAEYANTGPGRDVGRQATYRCLRLEGDLGGMSANDELRPSPKEGAAARDLLTNSFAYDIGRLILSSNKYRLGRHNRQRTRLKRKAASLVRS